MTYHKDMGFPETLIIPEILVNLQYTGHAIERQQNRIGGLKAIPSIARITKENVFEVSTENDIDCKKVLIRIPYDRKRDIVLVLELLSQEKAKVITFWLNNKKDQHKNFNKEKYNIPQNKITTNE